MARRIRLVATAVAMLLGGLALPGMVQAASAATITVNTSADELNHDGNCSLREAVESANTGGLFDKCHKPSLSGNTIVFASSTNGHPINLTLGSINIVSSMTIKGNGSSKTKVTGDEFDTGGGSKSTIAAMTLVDVNNENATVSLSAVKATGEMDNIANASQTSTMKITGSTLPQHLLNDSDNASADAILSITKSSTGPISNIAGFGDAASHLTVSGSRTGALHNISGSTSSVITKISTTTVKGRGKGSGVYVTGDGAKVSLLRDTVVHFGQGLFMDTGAVNLTDSTFSNFTSKTMKVSGGTLKAVNDTLSNSNIGIAQSSSGSVTLTNTIIALDKGKNCTGTVHSSGGNISDDSTCHLNGSQDRNGVDPKLGTLRKNGGPTQTELLKPGSPAIDHGLNSACPKVDQRGVKRPQDGNGDGKAVCDVGSVEVAKK